MIWQAVLFVVAPCIAGILGYRQGARDEERRWLLASSYVLQDRIKELLKDRPQ
jgi:hypothetical protein